MEKACYFCQKNIQEIDFKNTEVLRKFLSMQAKIAQSKRTGTCRNHQRKLSLAIKYARFMALLPFTTR
jgi:small subunit ribosomal protein S18